MKELIFENALFTIDNCSFNVGFIADDGIRFNNYVCID